jgi:hypothetical protein
MTDLAEYIYRGRIGADGLAGIRNPLVKVLTIAVPLSVIFGQHFARAVGWHRLSNGELVVVATVCYLSVIVNFEARERNRFIRRAIKWIAIVGAAYLLTLPSYRTYTTYLSFMTFELHILHSALGYLIDSESFSIILLIIPMYVGIRNFTTRDALWLGRHVLWNRLSNLLFEVYVVVIVGVSLINSALPLRVSVSWIVAKDKALLLKNADLSHPSNLLERVVVHVWLFASTLIAHNTRMAIAIETLTRQRGMFRKQYRDPIALNVSPEDIFVLIIFATKVFSFLVYRLAE